MTINQTRFHSPRQSGTVVFVTCTNCGFKHISNEIHPYCPFCFNDDGSFKNVPNNTQKEQVTQRL